MKYFQIDPPPQLSGIVRFFWVLEHETSEGQPYHHRTMADGCAEMVFHYQGIFDEISGNGQTEKSFVSGLSGPSAQFRRFSIHRSFGIFGVYLYPFVITQLFKIPGTLLANQMPDLHSLLGKEGEMLEEKIVTAAHHEERVNIISSFLSAKLANAPMREPGVFEVMKYIIHTQGKHNVETLAGKCFASVRQFERNFKSYSGLSPKLFSRVIRFHHTLAQYGLQKSLTQVAYEAGYYDQSHFIQDFKAFSGLNPRQYFSGNADGLSWIDA